MPADLVSTADIVPLADPTVAQRSQATLGFLTKVSYGLGEVADGVKTAALETFLFFYYVQVAGLSGSMAGLAVMIALLFDGFIDPAIGNFSDNLRSPIGRRHPFLYLSALPLAVCVFLLFTPPAGLHSWGLFCWMLGFTIISRVALSLYFVPHMALGAELTTDFRERVTVASYRALFGHVGRVVALWIAFSFFFKSTARFPEGQLNPAAYGPFALACGLISAGVILVSALGTQRRATEVYHQAREASLRHHSGSTWRNLTTAFRIRDFTVLFFAILISYILGGVQAALNIHLNTYYWRLPSAGIQWVFLFSSFGFMAGTFLAKPLADRFDKKPAYVACVILSVLMIALPIVLAQLGLYPVDNKPLLVVCLAANTFIAGVIGGPAFAISAAMLADVTDVYEDRFGVRSEGFLFGASAFTRKASLGVGGAIAGVALDLIHFPRGVPVDAVPHMATVKLALLFGPAMLIFSCISMSLLWTYGLDRRRHAEVLQRLSERARVAP